MFPKWIKQIKEWKQNDSWGGRETRTLTLDRFLWLSFILKSITAFENIFQHLWLTFEALNMGRWSCRGHRPVFWSFTMKSKAVFRGMGVHRALLKWEVLEQKREGLPSSSSCSTKATWNFLFILPFWERGGGVRDELWRKWLERLPDRRHWQQPMAGGALSSSLTSLGGLQQEPHTIFF